MSRNSKDCNSKKEHYGWRREGGERDPHSHSTRYSGDEDRYRNDSSWRRNDGYHHHGRERDDREYHGRRDWSRSNERTEWNDPQRNTRGPSNSNFERYRDNTGDNGLKKEEEGTSNELGNFRNVPAQGITPFSVRKLEDVPMESASRPQPTAINVTQKFEDATDRERENATSFATIAARRPELMPLKSADGFAPPKKKSKSENVKINETNWASATLEEKLRSQYPRDIMNLHIRDQIKDDKTNLMEKKIAAALYSLERIRGEIRDMNERRNEEPSDSEDSDEVPYHGVYGNKVDLSPPGISNFISALPYCILLDQGFKMWGAHPDDQKYCFCPCSKQMVKWRNNFDLCELSGIDKCESFRQNSPNAFMDHLRKIGEDDIAFHHRAVFYYLEKLYTRYWHEVSPGVDHKAIHAVSTAGHKNAEAAERKFLMGAIEHWHAENAKKEKELKEKSKRIEELQLLERSNEDLHKSLIQLQNNFKELNIIYEKKKVIADFSEDEVKKYRCSVPELINIEKERVLGGKEGKPITIETPAIINIQELFDEWYEKGMDDKTFLFRNLNNKNAKQYHVNKVLTKWNVKIGSVLPNGRRTIEGRDLLAVDEGGPTQSFVAAFCDQLGDLVIRIPIGRDVKEGSGSRLPLDFGGCAGTRVATKYEEGIVTGFLKKTSKYSVCFKSLNAHCLREDFTIKEVAISLFDRSESKSGLVPQRDRLFESIFKSKIKDFDSSMDYNQVLAKAKQYYRAVGRFFLHVIFDDQKLALSTKILPEFFMNVLLRGVLPESEDMYSMSDLMRDLHSIDRTFSVARQKHIKGEENIKVDPNKKQTYVPQPSSFADYGLDDEFLSKHKCEKMTQSTKITTENFRILVDLIALKTRDIAISSLREGITLDGVVRFKPIFLLVPSVVVSKLLFADPIYDVEKVISRLAIDDDTYLHDFGNELVETQKLCFSDTLPNALRILNTKDKEEFLVGLIFYITGSAYLPNLDMNPDWKILIEFSPYLSNDDLLTAATCAKCLRLSAWAYDNNVEELSKRLETTVRVGKYAGYGMN